MGRRAKMRGWKLPIAGPARALHGREWFEMWMRLRKQNGVAYKRGMTNQEAQPHLRGFVGRWGCHNGENSAKSCLDGP
eukprot:2821465-Amphidinium_carterae.1